MEESFCVVAQEDGDLSITESVELLEEVGGDSMMDRLVEKTTSAVLTHNWRLMNECRKLRIQRDRLSRELSKVRKALTNSDERLCRIAVISREISKQGGVFPCNDSETLSKLCRFFQDPEHRMFLLWSVLTAAQTFITCSMLFCVLKDT